MKLLVLSNFIFCHYVFKKLSAAEASESDYVRERVNSLSGGEKKKKKKERGRVGNKKD